MRGKIYSYLVDYGGEDKKAKGPKICVIKWKLKFEGDKNYLKTTKHEKIIIIKKIS